MDKGLRNDTVARGAGVAEGRKRPKGLMISEYDISPTVMDCVGIAEEGLEPDKDLEPEFQE